MEPERIVRGFLPPMTKKQAWEVFIGVSVMILGVFACWVLGVFTGMGFPGLARADDVDRRVQTSVQSVQKEVGEIKQQTAQIGASLNTVLSDYYMKKLRDDVRDRCKTPPNNVYQRDRISERIMQDYNLYRAHTESNEQLPLPGCNDV